MFNIKNKRQEEEKFYRLFVDSPVGISLTQLNGKLKVNQAFYNLLGYQVPELSNMHWKSITHKDDIAKSEEVIKQLLNSEKEIVVFHKRYIHKNGEPVWVEMTSTLQRDNKGKPISFINFVRDIEENKTSNLKQSSADDTYKLVFENATDALLLINQKTSKILDANESAFKLYGYAKNELLKMPMINLSAEPDQSLTDLKNFVKWVPERIHIKKDGSNIPVNLSVSYFKLKGIDCALISVRDITKQKEIETRMKNSEIRYRELFENNPQPMWFYDVESLKFLMVNNATIAKYGYSREEFMNMTIKDIRPAEDIPLLELKLKNNRSISQGDSVWRHKTKNGQIIFVEINSQYIQFNGWKARVVMATDVTEKKIAESKLINEYAKLNSIIESTSDIIFAVDRNYCYTCFNTNHAKVMKTLYGADIQIGKCLLDYQTEEDRVKAKANLDKALNGEIVHEISISGNKDYEQLYFEITHHPIKNDSGDIVGVSIYVKNVTELLMLLETVKRRESEYRELFANDLTGDFLSTIDGKILLCNKKFAEIYGFENEDEVYQVSSFDLYMNVADRAELISEIKLNGKVDNKEIRMKKKDGTEIIVIENVIGRFDENGQLQTLMGYVLDITQQTIAFQKVKQLSQAIEQSPTSIMITNKDAIIEYVNDKYTEVTGYSKEELLGKNPRILSSGKGSKEFYADLWNTITSGNTWRGEFHNRKKNGELYWESASISPIKNSKGEIINYIGVKEDITIKKQAERELIAAKEKAEELNRIKSNFFSNMSHELRTPLSGILGFSEILLEELQDVEHKRMINAITINGQRLLETLNKILQISKLESEKPVINIQQLNICEQLKDIVKDFESNLITKGIYLKLNCSRDLLIANLDADLFRTAISNVISNAIKFTSKGGVTISCSSHKINDQDLAIIEVADTGIGISEKDIDIIFSEFRQASEGLSRHFEGTGLGLTIAKKYTAILGGRISVESKLGLGSTFTIQFPRLLTSFDNDNTLIEPEIKESETIITPQNKPKVLLVEDDFMNTHIIKKFLVDLCEMDTIQSGEEAVELVKVKKYEAILMDIGLGEGMNGVETTQVIRKIDGYANIPIIAVTAYAMNGDKERFLASGFTGYISKPFKMGELVNVLGKALKLL